MSQNTGPTVEFFETDGTKPGVNTDVRIQVSLNGKLIVVNRTVGKGPEPEQKEVRELYGVNWVEFDNLVGRLLTLCDATFTDPQQRKAFKDLVRHAIKEWVASIINGAAEDAGRPGGVSVPFVGGVLDQPGGLFGVEGEPTP
jgi:hypothetical protein